MSISSGSHACKRPRLFNMWMLTSPSARMNRSTLWSPPILFVSPSPLLQRRPFSFPFFTDKARRAGRATVVVPCASLRPTNPATQYVPLHVHSDFSLLDGASQLPALVERAERLGVPALALTDHGVLYGAIQLVRSCANTPVKPIIGNEMYVVNDDLSPNREIADPPPKRYHLIVLAKNTIGYRNLVKLTTMAHLSGKIGKGIFARPCVNKSQLYQHREGLIVSSACLGGEIAQAILNNDIEAARAVATWFRDVFGEDFYLEIQDHGSNEDKKVNPVMIKLSEELGIKVIATNDSHFTSCLDAEAHDAMICIQTGKMLTDENRLHYAGNEYFKSIEEMRQCFVDHLPVEVVDEALYNTIDVAAKVDTYDLFGSTRIPDFPVPRRFSESHDKYLRRVSREGLSERLKARVCSGLVNESLSESYNARLEEELDMICRMGFSSYFLVVWDYIKHARELNVPVGPGRGSVAGSLVAFALRITDVDPITFNLLFERFLNPERKSMPDIDTDFSVEGRERVIAYVTERYGRDRVAQIITFNRLTSKAVLKDVARVHNVPYAEADRLAKLIPVVRGKPATLSQLLSEKPPSQDFKRSVERNPSYMTWLDKAQRIEGANKTYGIHAAGVVISATSLTDVVPLSKAKHGETITQYAMEDVEALGLLKMDFLGLKNLSIIETALRFINEGRRRVGINQDLDFSVDGLPLDDPKTYKLFTDGELDGIFQMDASAGMRSIVRELRPSSLEDISSILALYRPGPLDAGLIPKFIRRKHGVEPIEYEHPLLEPILKETYGIMVYQEQIMRIARDLAGYSLGQADILRRAMGKKKMKDMEREKPIFVKGAVGRGVPEDIATNLFDQMLKFADYCFNKSHSTAYAYLTYQTAFLKANYPVEYCAALLRSNMNQSEKLVRYLADANAHGVRVLPPSVNRSELGFTVDRNDKDGAVILFGLEAVKTVGDSVASALIAERKTKGPFYSIVDLIERVDMRVLNKRAMGALVRAGAFDELHPNRKVLLDHLDNMLVLRRKLRDKRKRREAKGMSDEEEEELDQDEHVAWEDAKVQLEDESAERTDFTMLERLSGEKATMGFYASGHPLHDFENVAQRLGCVLVSQIVGMEGNDGIENQSQEIDSSANVIADGADVMILSCVSDLKRLTTAKGKKMGKWTIEDATGRVPAVVFPEAHEIMEQVDDCPRDENPIENGREKIREKKTTHVVEEDARVIVWGKVDRESSGSAQIIVDDVQKVEDVLVIMATAEHDQFESVSGQVHALRQAAATILNIHLNNAKSLTFIDPNGERRRRRKKVSPLAERNRVALILESLNKKGEPETYQNVGNAVRFPIDCAGYLDSLYEITGFRCRILSVSRDLASEDLANKEEKAVDSGTNDITPVEAQMSKLSLASPVPAKQKQNNVEDIEAEQKDPIKRIGSGSELSNVDVPSSFKSQEEHASAILEELNVKDEGVIARNFYLRNALTPIEMHDLIGADISRRRDDEIMTLMTEKAEKAKQSGNGSQVDRQLLSLIRTMQRDPMSTRVFSKINGVKQFSRHNAFHAGHESSEPKPSSVLTAALPVELADSEVAMGETPVNNGSGGNPRSQVQTSDFVNNEPYSLHHQLKLSEMSSENESNCTPEQTQVLEPEVTDDVDSDSEIRVSRDDEKVETDAKRDHNVPANVMVNTAFAKPHTSVMKRIRSQKSVSSTHSKDEKPAQADEIRDAEMDELKEGLIIAFEDAELSGLIDAIVLVSSHVVSRRFGGKHTIIGMSEMNMEKLSESGVLLHLSGRVVSARGHEVQVLVDVRETTPSAKRKRVRSFGPVAVIYQTSETITLLDLKTKKAKQNVDSFVQKLSKCCMDVTTDAVENGNKDVGKVSGRRKSDKSVLHIRASDVGFATVMDIEGDDNSDKRNGTVHLIDGGEILSYMARAADICAAKAVGEKGLMRLTIMEWMCVSDPAVWNGVKKVCVRTHLQRLSFAVIKVEVEAEVLTCDGGTHKVRAEFGACCRGGKLKRMHVIDDDEPLFSKSKVIEPLMTSKRALRTLADLS